MIEKHDFLRQAELEIHNTKTVSQFMCQAWATLPSEVKAAFVRAMVFLGCQPNGTKVTLSQPASASDRVAAARLMFLKLGLDSNDPRWSSDVLDRLVDAVMEQPDGSVADLIGALFGVMGDYCPELSKPTANFIKDLVVVCFTRYRESYDSVDWKRFVETFTGAKLTKAQLYLMLYAIPPQFASSELTDAITRGLEYTDFHEEALSALTI